VTSVQAMITACCAMVCATILILGVAGLIAHDGSAKRQIDKVCITSGGSAGQYDIVGDNSKYTKRACILN
jgi:hypothetical protein